MLAAAGIECVRGGRRLFRGLDLAAGAGELVRIAGANGSGKTSLLRILCGLLEPAAGEVKWKGEPIRALREEYSRELVYLGHAGAVKGELTAAENLVFACRIAGNRASEGLLADALARFGVPGTIPVRKLSQGQRRRAALARLAVSAAPLWLLDEPFAALDAAAVAQVEALVQGHVARGGAVLYTTHQAAGIDAAVSRVVELQ